MLWCVVMYRVPFLASLCSVYKSLISFFLNKQSIFILMTMLFFAISILFIVVYLCLLFSTCVWACVERERVHNNLFRSTFLFYFISSNYMFIFYYFLIFILSILYPWMSLFIFISSPLTLISFSYLFIYLSIYNPRLSNSAASSRLKPNLFPLTAVQVIESISRSKQMTPSEVEWGLSRWEVFWWPHVRGLSGTIVNLSQISPRVVGVKGVCVCEGSQSFIIAHVILSTRSLFAVVSTLDHCLLRT
jgi:hypothetical protein